MASGSSRSQRIKRWILLLFSAIAVVIWIRNLRVFLSDHEPDLPSREVQQNSESRIGHLRAQEITFANSSKWSDPFAPPSQRVLPKSTDTTRIARGALTPPPEPPPWKLTGVVWNKKSPAAILASVNDDRRVVISLGDTLGVTRIERIEEGFVWIRHHGRTWKLSLDEADTAHAR